MRLNPYFALAAMLLLVFTVLLIDVAQTHSPIWDETPTMSIGYYTLTTNDFRMNYHPPTGFELLALPLLGSSATLPPNAAQYVDTSYLAYVGEFTNSLDNAHELYVRGRMASILFGIGIALIILLWATKLYGRNAGLFALSLFVLNPIILGNIPVITNDIPALFFITLSLYLFWRFTTNQTWLLAFGVGTATSFAILSKFTALLLLPSYFIIWFLVWRDQQLPLRINLLKQSGILERFRLFIVFAIIIGIVFLLTTLVLYRGQFGTIGEQMPPHHVEMVEGKLGMLPGGNLILHTPIPIPSLPASVMQIYGVATIAHKPAQLFGEVYDGGKWFYFPLEFIFKTPLVLLLIFTLALISLKRTSIRTTEWFLIVPFLVYVLMLLQVNENFGIRHLLPLYPLLIIFSSRVVKFIQTPLQGIKPEWIYGLGVGILLLLVLTQHPYHFSYFNELAGGSDNGHNLMVANSDQGQSLKALKTYMDENNIERIQLSYFGSVNPSVYGIEYDYLQSSTFQPWDPAFNPSDEFSDAEVIENCAPTTGLLAISATNYHNVHFLNRNCYDWLHEHEPVDILANSILIFDIT